MCAAPTAPTAVRRASFEHDENLRVGVQRLHQWRSALDVLHGVLATPVAISVLFRGTSTGRRLDCQAVAGTCATRAGTSETGTAGVAAGASRAAAATGAVARGVRVVSLEIAVCGR